MKKKLSEVTEKRMGADIVLNLKSEFEMYKNTVQYKYLSLVYLSEWLGILIWFQL